MEAQTLSLGALKGFRPVIDVRAFCADCSQPLGDYFYAANRDGLWTLSEKQAHNRGDGETVIRPTVRGPRTQPGLYPEAFGDRYYIRKKCTCPANQKRPFSAISSLPVTVHDAHTVTLMF